MKLKYLILSAIAGALMAPTMAQSPAEGDKDPSNVVQKIISESNGNVVIDIPDYIITELEKDDPVQHKKQNLKPGINKMNGYRIQIFSDGRNQHSLESRARARGSAVVAKFPKYRGQVYSFSSSPNWYTRVGNFRNAEDASEALAELKRAFPQFASEMRVVKSQIVVIK